MTNPEFPHSSDDFEKQSIDTPQEATETGNRWMYLNLDNERMMLVIRMLDHVAAINNKFGGSDVLNAEQYNAYNTELGACLDKEEAILGFEYNSTDEWAQLADAEYYVDEDGEPHAIPKGAIITGRYCGLEMIQSLRLSDEQWQETDDPVPNIKIDCMIFHDKSGNILDLGDLPDGEVVVSLVGESVSLGKAMIFQETESLDNLADYDQSQGADFSFSQN